MPIAVRKGETANEFVPGHLWGIPQIPRSRDFWDYRKGKSLDHYSGTCTAAWHVP